MKGVRLWIHYYSWYTNFRGIVDSTKPWKLRIQRIYRVMVYGVWPHFQQYFSYIVAVSFICGGNRSTWRKPPTCHKSNKLYHIMFIEYTSPWTGFELTTLVVIDTDCICRCKSNYHIIATMTAQQKLSFTNLNESMVYWLVTCSKHFSPPEIKI